MLGNDTCHFSPHFFGQCRSCRVRTYHPSVETGTTSHMAKPEVIGMDGGHSPFPGVGRESCIRMAIKKGSNDALMCLVLLPS